MAERPRFRVNIPSFIGHATVAAGQEVIYTPPEGGEVHDNLTPLNDEAQAIVDDQVGDHPDKTIHQGKKRKAAAKAEAEASELEAESPNGPLPKGVKAKGDTRKPPAERKAAKEPAKGKGAAQEPAKEPDEDEEAEGEGVA